MHPCSRFEVPIKGPRFVVWHVVLGSAEAYSSTNEPAPSIGVVIIFGRSLHLMAFKVA